MLRGKVLGRDGKPLAGVSVSILNHPEYGSTISRADGMFDLAVNGGMALTVSYAKAGFTPVQRQIQAPYQAYTWVPNVVLIPYDTKVTAISQSATSFQAAQGSPVSDSSGRRQATVLFPPQTQASLTLGDGRTMRIDATTPLQVRATEYTVGNTGPAAMPGTLPPSSGYTYAVELSVDQAAAAGAADVQFNQPVFFYVENFLQFPVGGAVPMGYYDRLKGEWVPSQNGRVIKILSVAGGIASLDTDGDGAADNATTLSNLGVTNGERQQLAVLYQAGVSLWRVPITHFTPWDCNWPFGPSADARAPQLPPATSDAKPNTEDCNLCPGSTIELESQVLGEDVDVVGTPFSLNYRSDRVPGRTAASQLRIPLSGASLPASLKRIELEVQAAGQFFTQSFPPTPNQSYTFVWDGKDGYGRIVQGSQPVQIRIGYVYEATYQEPAQFSQSFAAFSGVPLTGNRTRQEVTIWQEQRATVGAWDARAQGIGGWSISVHHAYDPAGRVLYKGDGSRRSAAGDAIQVIETVAGNGQLTGSTEGVPATEARLSGPEAVAFGPDGSLYIADGNTIWRVGANGIIIRVAGKGTAGFSGDGGPAAQAQLYGASGVAIGPDGTIYIADRFNNRVRKVTPSGTISTLAGTGVAGYNGDGRPAAQAQLDDPRDVALGPDGSLYIVDSQNNRLRRVGLDGIITTVAGTGAQAGSGQPGCTNVFAVCGDGGPATLALLNLPQRVTVAPDGTIYVSDSLLWRLRSIGSDGIIREVSQLGIWQGQGIAVDPNDGALYISYYYGLGGKIFLVSPDGSRTLVAGDGSFGGFGGDGGPAALAQLNAPQGIAVAPDGSIYIADWLNRRVRRVGPPLPGFASGNLLIASEDGGDLYEFSATGRHLRTLNTLTGATRYQFGYDPGGQLISVTDGDGNQTTIARNASGVATAIVGPYGQRTTLSLDANGFLSSITDPAGARIQLASSTTGLLSSMTDARGNTFSFSYDAAGRLTQDSDPAGGTQSLGRSTTNDSYTVTHSTGLSRDSQSQVAMMANGGRRHTSTNPDGTTSTLLIGSDGTRVSTTPDGSRSTVIQGPDPRFDMQAPIPAAQTITTPLGLRLSAFFTRTAELTTPANPLSLQTLTSTLTLNGRTATSIYDSASRTTTSTSPANRQASYTIDAQGRVTTAQVAGLAPVAATYDARGRLASLTVGSGAAARTTSYTYNPAGYLASMTDPLGRTISFTYDSAGRVTQQTLPDGQKVSFAYDANGNLTSLTPPGRTAHDFSYSTVNQATSYSPPGVGASSSQTQYSYNADRQLTRVTRPDGKTVDLSYDSAGRVSSVTIARGAISYSYSPTTGLVTAVSAPGSLGLAYTYDGFLPTGVSWSGAVAGSVGYSYDRDFRVASLSVNGANPIAYEYDGDSLLTQAGALALTHSAQNGLLTGSALNSVTDTWGYNSFGEPTSYSALAGATSLYSVSYTRDKLGRITQKVETIGGVATTYAYSYDSRGRLTGVTRNGAPAESYSYDANGNRLSATVNGSSASGNYDAQDRLTSYGGATYSYTANGELLSKTNGGQTTSYQYDELGNLLAVTLPNGTTITYLIDGQNRRIGRQVNGTLGQSWLYDGQLRPIAELDGSGAIVSRFVYASRANVPDYMIKGGVTYRIIADQLGSPRLVVNSATGAVAQRMDYDSFGNVTQDTAPGFQPFGFAGGLYDRDTKLLRFGARDYDPLTGRWTAKDPIGFAGGDANLYAYVAGDSVNFIDIQGSSPIIAAAIIGGIIGAGLDIAAQLGSGKSLGEICWGEVALAGLGGAIVGVGGAYFASPAGIAAAARIGSSIITAGSAAIGAAANLISKARGPVINAASKFNSKLNNLLKPSEDLQKAANAPREIEKLQKQIDMIEKNTL